MARKKQENLQDQNNQNQTAQPSGDFELQVDIQMPSTQEALQEAAQKSISESVKTVEEQIMQEREEMDLEIPAMTSRVPNQTLEDAGEEIRRRTQERVAYYASRLDKIQQRLDELEKEWDVQRTLQRNASAIALGGLVLSLFKGRKWLVFPLMAATFLMQHAFTGWCPPIIILRRLGYRTLREIEQERIALKALRGDFDMVKRDESDPVIRALTAIEAARPDGPQK